MVTDMLIYMNEINDYVYNLLLQSFQLMFKSLMAKTDENVADENKTDGSTHPLIKLKPDVNKWAKLIPVIGKKYVNWKKNMFFWICVII